ncbi:MAG: redoxin domain-containing protein [Variovorax sp.]|nr:MAG: redoxin domain-containing protein [Variovorax sp.]
MRTLSRRTFSGMAMGAALATTASMWPLRPARAADPALRDYGKAPEFRGIDTWLNSEPLTLQALAGKVVLVDFWTYGCYNCVNTLPHVVGWYEKYKNQGFVVVGIHSPEFAYEKPTRNVSAAMKKHGIAYPVAQDNGFQTWRAYDNKYWPSFYLVDKQGRVRRRHDGEGEYAQMDAAIRVLLAEKAPG